MSAIAPETIVARCGLACSNCGAYRHGKCAGCHSEKPMFSRCPVKACAIEKACTTCADCTAFPDLRACPKLNSFLSRLFGLIFRSDRIGNLYRIRQIGLEAFKTERQAAGRK
jgi:hypothetical protein